MISKSSEFVRKKVKVLAKRAARSKGESFISSFECIFSLRSLNNSLLGTLLYEYFQYKSQKIPPMY